MIITQKCQYALRAIYELARHADEGPLKIGTIAEAQNIPVRFLENILSGLKNIGLVDSARGKDGGYFLLKSAEKITIGEIIRFIQGPLGPVECTTRTDEECNFIDDCVFRPLWDKARIALEQVYDGTTMQDLLDKSQKNCCSASCNCGKKK
ncbi:MAG: Rrf2 family transcriptional regulator [Synergistaceae bacterium]